MSVAVGELLVLKVDVILWEEVSDRVFVVMRGDTLLVLKTERMYDAEVLTAEGIRGLATVSSLSVRA